MTQTAAKGCFRERNTCAHAPKKGWSELNILYEYQIDALFSLLSSVNTCTNFYLPVGFLTGRICISFEGAAMFGILNTRGEQ